jgi:excisionase family DNA binding protein
MDKLLLRPTEAADLIGMGRAKTYELIRDGTLPSVRIGKSLRVPARALQDWVDQLADANAE